MNKKLSPGFLLDENGNLNECGYATSFVKKYDKSQIKARKSRIKEWDYYYIGDDEYGIAMTIDDNGYMGLCSSSILGFKDKLIVNKANMFWFPMGKVGMPNSSKTGNVERKRKHYHLKFINDNGQRHLYYRDDNVKGKKLEVDVKLYETTPLSLVIATPFKKDKHFYYNQKINNLKVIGEFSWGDLKHTFKPNAYGVLDWGRGVWTYSNTWYWSSMSGMYNGNLIGFNLGYGFGDTSAASENILFVNHEAYKLDDIEFKIPKDENGKEEYLKPWKLVSKSGDIDLSFVPILDRHDKSSAIIIAQDAHQVFGKFSGTFKINNKIIVIKDMIGFAEKVKNRW